MALVPREHLMAVCDSLVAVVAQALVEPPRMELQCPKAVDLQRARSKLVCAHEWKAYFLTLDNTGSPTGITSTSTVFFCEQLESRLAGAHQQWGAFIGPILRKRRLWRWELRLKNLGGPITSAGPCRLGQSHVPQPNRRSLGGLDAPAHSRTCIAMTTLASQPEISAQALNRQHDESPHDTVGGVFLASLHPLSIAPSEFSTRTRVVLSLRRIEFLRVEASPDNASLYQIQVFYKPPENHIPLSEYTTGRTHSMLPSWRTSTISSARTREPDVVVEKHFADLVKLREDLFHLARVGHQTEPCAYCLGVIFYGGYGRAKPHRTMTWLHRQETVREKLSLFLNDMLELVTKAKAFHADKCVGQERIPLAFHRFLQPRSQQARASLA